MWSLIDKGTTSSIFTPCGVNAKIAFDTNTTAILLNYTYQFKFTLLWQFRSGSKAAICHYKDEFLHMLWVENCLLNMLSNVSCLNLIWSSDFELIAISYSNGIDILSWMQFLQPYVTKVLVPIYSLIPQYFSNIWKFWYQKLSHI